MEDGLFSAAGSLRGFYEDTDWSKTPFGALETWSPTLRSTVRLLLRTDFACSLLWGPEFGMLYNEAYVELIGSKHPGAIGSTAREVFPEAWPYIGPMMAQVTETDESISSSEEFVPLDRNGFLEALYFTFCYSPVTSAEGQVEGVLVIATEATAEVLARRRLELLTRLRAALAGLGDEETEAVRSQPDSQLATIAEVKEQILLRALTVLEDYPSDFSAVELRASMSSPASGAPADGPGLPARPSRPWDASADLVLEAEASENGEGPDQVVAWLPVPTVDTRDDPVVLVAALNPQLAPDRAFDGFLRLIASSIGLALDRAENIHAERAAALSRRQFSEALQRGLLGSAAQGRDLEVAVRYAPATHEDKIGGDWHDSFIGPDGSLHLVVGDVSGHDRVAALEMGQARNILRGITFALDGSPGGTLERFDHAVSALALGGHITAILARVEADPDGDLGVRRLSWSNAGHPPPLLIEPGGTVRFLWEGHGPMLGMSLADHRQTGTVDLEPGATLVLYTDGLVERAGVHLDESLEALRRTALEGYDLAPDELCDLLLAEAGDSLGDDVALVVARVRSAQS